VLRESELHRRIVVLDEDVKRGAERERSLMEEVKTLESHVERIQVEYSVRRIYNVRRSISFTMELTLHSFRSCSYLCIYICRL
jgi:hypothetical protein